MSSREGTPDSDKNVSSVADEKKDEKKDKESVKKEDILDMITFEQLLEMDDEDNHEFSLSLVENYYEQATTTFKQMDEAQEKKDLSELSRLGHFLKGSSAAIGLKEVKNTCEKIQNAGNLLREDKKNENEEEKEKEKEEALKLISKFLEEVKSQYEAAVKVLNDIYSPGTTVPNVQ
ncbi:hypothetical protein [Parasitella parasitica]|uniref:HPt domain-containing protein n=1 Tax=Parasitella parasitica TaxID=35722 RepID=A0A0B7N2E8_9FUNG|nr:hypothetical protein [Parasitella parasitica]